MLDHSDTENTIYDIRDSLYWDKESLESELDRVYDICIGCRLCFNLCPSFPSLFDSVDNAGDRKRQIAEEQGRVEIEEKREEYLDLPEGEHASEASIEVEFRGEVTDLTDDERWEVVDLCYQCKLCDPVCPYTPGKEHDFKLDFPKLMTRAQAIRTRDRGVKINDRFLSNLIFIDFLLRTLTAAVISVTFSTLVAKAIKKAEISISLSFPEVIVSKSVVASLNVKSCFKINLLRSCVVFIAFSF